MQVPLFRLVLVAAFILWGSSLSAQTEDALLQQLSQIAEQPPPTKIGVNLQQEGFQNEAYIIQISEASSSTLISRQVGNGNTINLMQSGNYVDIKVSQRGDENFYEADVEGNNSRIHVSQSGDENFIFQSLILDNSGITIHQNGNQNEVIHTGTSTNSGIQVQQQGSGMKVIIQTN